MVTAYYQTDLAWVHHTGYAQYAEQVAPGIQQLLRDAGLGKGASVLDVGCGSGVLAGRLHAAGFDVLGIDASPAMIELACEQFPSVRFEVLDLGEPGCALPRCDAVVSTGHVLNYLESNERIEKAIGQMTRALRPGGLLAIDLMTMTYGERPDLGQAHANVQKDWTIVTRLSRPERDRFDRMITVFRRLDDGLWRRSDEHHRNLAFDADEALRVLRKNGVAANLRRSFGSETLPDGIVVLSGMKEIGTAA